jgi:hypothetical protein
MKRATNLKLVRGGAKPAPPTATPEIRGYLPVYRPGELNRCPGCGRSNWWVRSMAECGFCATALPFVTDGRVPEEAK